MHKIEVTTLFQYERFEQLRLSRGVTKTFIAQSLGRSATLCQDWKQQKSQPNDQQLLTTPPRPGTRSWRNC